MELAKVHPLNGGYLERHPLRARILNAPARIVTQSTPYIHPLQGWRFCPFSFCLFPFYFLKIKRLGVQKTRNVTENGEYPIIFAPFSRRRDVKPKGKANQGERGRKSMQARKRRRPNVLRNGANHLQRRGVFFGRGVFLVFARLFPFVV